MQTIARTNPDRDAIHVYDALRMCPKAGRILSGRRLESGNSSTSSRSWNRHIVFRTGHNPVGGLQCPSGPNTHIFRTRSVAMTPASPLARNGGTARPVHDREVVGRVPSGSRDTVVDLTTKKHQMAPDEVGSDTTEDSAVGVYRTVRH